MVNFKQLSGQQKSHCSDSNPYFTFFAQIQSLHLQSDLYAPPTSRNSCRRIETQVSLICLGLLRQGYICLGWNVGCCQADRATLFSLCSVFSQSTNEILCISVMKQRHSTVSECWSQVGVKGMWSWKVWASCQHVNPKQFAEGGHKERVQQLLCTSAEFVSLT